MLGRHLLYQTSPPIPIGEKWTITSDSTWIAPTSGNYKITLVGAGGAGGSGGHTYPRQYKVDTKVKCQYIGGGGGGGGGAGETTIIEKALKKGAALSIAIGVPNGGSSTITGDIGIIARGGGSGGSGGDGQYDSDAGRPKPGAGGAAASVNYGTGISGGGPGSAKTASSPCSSLSSDLNGVHGAGGAGATSAYGNNYGRGGTGASTHAGTGANGTQGVCIIEYRGR